MVGIYETRLISSNTLGVGETSAKAFPMGAIYCTRQPSSFLLVAFVGQCILLKAASFSPLIEAPRQRRTHKAPLRLLSHSVMSAFWSRFIEWPLMSAYLPPSSCVLTHWSFSQSSPALSPWCPSKDDSWCKRLERT